MLKTSYLTLLLSGCLLLSCQVEFGALQQALDEQYVHHNPADYCRFDTDKQEKARTRMLKRYRSYYDHYCTHTDSLANWNNQGVRLAQSGGYVRAIEKFRKALAAEEHPTVRYNLAMTRYLAGEPQLAQAALQQVGGGDDFQHVTHNELVAEISATQDVQWPSLATPEADFASRYALTSSFAATDPLPEAQAASADPCNCVAAQRRGVLEWRDSLFADAAAAFAQASKQDFCANENRFNYAMSLWKLGDREAALAELAAVEAPLRAEQYYGSGLVYYDLQDWRRAKSYFRRAARAGDDWVRGYVGAGNVCIRQGEFAEGHDYFSLALASDPDDHAALLGKAICIYEHTRNEFNFFTPYQLRECVELLQKIDPKESNPQITFQANLLLGYALLKESLFGGTLQNEQYRAILASFRKALDIRPGHVPCLIGVALTEHQLGNHAAAQRVLDEALLQEQDNPHIFNIKASLLYNQDEHRAARQNYQRAYTLDTTNVEALNGLGITNRKLLEYAASIRYLQKLVAQSQKHVYHDKYLNNLALSRYYHAQELEQQYLVDSNQQLLDSTQYAYQRAIDEMYAAFALEQDSTFLFNIGTVVSDSCIGRFQNDSIVRHFYLLGGRQNGRYIANNLGVLFALRDSHRVAKAFFDQAIIPEDRRYATPLWNLERLGEKMSPRQVRVMTVAQQHSPRFQHNRDGFIYTLIYHYNYLYRFELYDKLPNENIPVLAETAPDMIYEFRYLECTSEKTKRKRKREAGGRGKKGKTRKYKGGCPSF